MRQRQRSKMASGQPRSRSSALSQASDGISEMLLLIRASTMRAQYLRAISRRSPSLRLQLSIGFIALAPTCWRISIFTVGSNDEGLTTQTCVEARMIITVYLKICVKLGVDGPECSQHRSSLVFLLTIITLRVSGSQRH